MSSVYVDLPLDAGGTDGEGVPVGGTTGQVLAKASGTDYDTEWVDQGPISLTSGVTGVLPLANGGSQLTNVMVDISTSGTINQLPLSSTQIRLTSAGGAISINGIAAPSPAADITVTIYKANSNSVLFTHQNTGATAVDRLNLPNSSTFVSYLGTSITLRYNTVTSRWDFMSGIQLADTTRDGWVTAATITSFNSKQEKITDTSAVPYSTGTELTSNSNRLLWDATKYRLALNKEGVAPEAGIHVAIQPTTTLQDPTSPSATATLVSSLAPTTPGSFSASQDGGLSGFTADGSNFDYTLYANKTVFGITFRSAGASANFSDSNDSSSLGAALTWTDTASEISYTLVRNTPTSANQFIPQNSSSWSDQNNLADDGVVYSQLTGYTSTGQTYTYRLYDYETINGFTIYVSNYVQTSATLTNDSQSRVIELNYTTANPTKTGTRVLRATDGVTFSGAYDFVGTGTQLLDYAGLSWTGSTTVIPTEYVAPSMVSDGVVRVDSTLSVSAPATTIPSSTRLHVFTNSASTYAMVIQAASSQSANLLEVRDVSATVLTSIGPTGKQSYDSTITAGGTTGNRTINKPTGTVNFAAAATSITVTNSLCTTSSIVFAVVRTNDTTATIKNVVPASGSFTIRLNAAATAETSVGFIVFN